MREKKKGSDKESAKAKRKQHSKQQNERDAEASGGMRKRHSKAMRAPRRHARREVGVGMRLPAYYDEIAGEVA